MLGRNEKNDATLLKQAFRSKDTPAAHEKAILDDYGIRWSVINLISGWMPSWKTALDFMHNIFLGTFIIYRHL